MTVEPLCSVLFEPVRSADRRSVPAGGREGLQRPQRRLAGGQVPGFGSDLPDRGVGEIGPVLRKPALHPSLKRLCQIGPLRRIGVEARLPLRFQRRTPGLRVPGAADLVGYLEGRVFPAEPLARRGDLLRSQRRAVGVGRALLVRRPPADERLAADQGRAPVSARAAPRADVTLAGSCPSTSSITCQP